MTKKTDMQKILQKVELEKLAITKINAELITNHTPNTAILKVKWNYTHEIDIKKQLLKILLNSKVFFEPETICKIEIAYSLNYKLKEDANFADIDDYIEELVAPCGNINSLVVGQLSDKIIDSPFIIPPIVSFEEKEYGKVEIKQK